MPLKKSATLAKNKQTTLYAVVIQMHNLNFL